MSIDVPGMKAERVEGTAAARQVEEPDFWPLARLLSLPTLARPPPSPPSWDSASSPQAWCRWFGVWGARPLFSLAAPLGDAVAPFTSRHR